MSDFFQEIKHLLEEEKAKGTFTHYAFSCGSFFPGEPSFTLLGREKESFFDLASLTKPFVTSALFLEEFSSEKASEKTKVKEYLKGEFGGLSEELGQLTLGSLLSHSSGLPAWHNFWVKVEGEEAKIQKDCLISRLNECAKKLSPEQGFLYSDVGFVLLGILLELRYKKSLKELFYSYCKDKLNFCDRPLLWAKEAPKNLCVPTSFCSLRKRTLKGEVHDENCAFLGGATGHAGLFGELSGVVSYMKKLSRRSSFSRVVSPLRRHDVCSYGWRTKTFGPRVAFGHLGFTGCGFFFFPEEHSYLCLLTNRVVSGRLNPSFQKLRERVFQLGRNLLDHELNK